MSDLVLPLVNGVAYAMLMFIVASGLTLVYGTMRVVNFAHGGFFAIGAFLTFAIAGGAALPFWEFFAAGLAAAAICGVLGAAAEMLIFRRIYSMSHSQQLLATYALLLILEGALTLVWGNNPRSQNYPVGLQHAVTLFGVPVSSYYLVLIGIGVVVGSFLWFLLTRTAVGRQVRAVAGDRAMSACLGINVGVIFTAMFALGVFLAGVGGALASPLFQLDSTLAGTLVLESFAVVLIGGAGSISGAVIASLLLGLLNSFLVQYAPNLAQFSLYMVMAGVLLARPTGLLGAGILESR